ncbi:UDP-galactose transporter senju-like [Galendromus occidentalis]|uniref:UDP-galactose transporter senju-like n=1 Tax=Galendromus occidentalis TaxID=34638 RepID=A0AAJ7P959_9ACAR|nr:UDP-galactose transporter senju-like [Galendromus occidentalis]
MSQPVPKSKFFGDIFPTRFSALIFVGYIVFFIAQSILVKASQTNRSYSYNVTCVVMLTELLKLVLSTFLYLNDERARQRRILRHIFGEPIVLLIIANGALCGIIVSVFLRNLNSILKTFAGALDLSFSAVLCWFMFSIPIDMPTIVAISIVSIATYLYSQNPVVNKVKETEPKSTSDIDLKDELLVSPV